MCERRETVDLKAGKSEKSKGETFKLLISSWSQRLAEAHVLFETAVGGSRLSQDQDQEVLWGK